MVAFLRFFEIFDIALERCFVFERQAVDPRHHRILFVSSPIRAGDLVELERIRIDLFHGLYMRSFAHVDERDIAPFERFLECFIPGEIFVDLAVLRKISFLGSFEQIVLRGQRDGIDIVGEYRLASLLEFVDQVDLELFAEHLDDRSRLIIGELYSRERLSFLDDLDHHLVDLLDLLLLAFHAFGKDEIIIESGVYRRSNTELSKRIQCPLDGLREDMRKRVTTLVQCIFFVIHRND